MDLKGHPFTHILMYFDDCIWDTISSAGQGNTPVLWPTSLEQEVPLRGISTKLVLSKEPILSRKIRYGWGRKPGFLPQKSTGKIPSGDTTKKMMSSVLSAHECIYMLKYSWSIRSNKWLMNKYSSRKRHNTWSSLHMTCRQRQGDYVIIDREWLAGKLELRAPTSLFSRPSWGLGSLWPLTPLMIGVYEKRVHHCEFLCTHSDTYCSICYCSKNKIRNSGY